MAELKLPRLLAAAKEFNIGQDTLIEFLVKKGFNRDDLKPTARKKFLSRKTRKKLLPPRRSQHLENLKFRHLPHLNLSHNREIT